MRYLYTKRNGELKLNEIKEKDTIKWDWIVNEN